ncbi:MAG: hypothetical protein Q9219_000005 [cf. Caloplaca sp. 3 TL-2023]
MSTFNSHPPIRHHSSQPISFSHAQQLLADFLERTVTDVSLHPNALLTEEGPINRSASTGLVLHNLKRVEAGLRGEHLAADLSFENFGGEGLPDLMSNAVADGGGNSEINDGNEGKVPDTDWQDKDEYDREQALGQGEIGSRNSALGDFDHVEGFGKVDEAVPTVKPADGPSRAEKDERQRKKKEKREQRKKAREKELAARRNG